MPHILIKYVIDPFEAKFIRSQNQRFRGQNSFANFIINKMEMSLTYYVSLGLELADLCLELLHYLHMVLWSNALFSVASFALCMHVRYLTTEIQKKIKKHRNYIWILNHMEKEYVQPPLFYKSCATYELRISSRKQARAAIVKLLLKNVNTNLHF